MEYPRWIWQQPDCPPPFDWQATATRHLADLLEKGVLQRLAGGGRSTRYTIVGEGRLEEPF